MIRFTADDGFNARLEERSYQLYNLLRYLRNEDWEFQVKEFGVHQRAADILNYIENGWAEETEAGA